MDWKRIFADSQATLDDLKINIDSRILVRDLTIGQQEMVSIAKIIHQKANVIVFDEPTALLTNEEVEILFNLIGDLKKRGFGIIYISHRMEEIFQLCDRVTILTIGSYVDTLNVSETNEKELVSLMVGRSVEDMYGIKHAQRGDVKLEVRNLTGARFKDISFQVRKGDEVNVVPAVPGEDAAALLSDQYDMSGMSLLTVNLDGRQLTAGDHILVNGTPTAQDADIENGAVLRRIRLDTLGALLAQDGLPAEGARVNGESQSPEYTLRDGDVITSAPEEAPAQESTEDGVPIVFNGMPAVFPTEPGRQPVFLDILAAFSDDPTGLLAGSSTVMINGKLARLDEVIHPGDEIVIE